MESLLTITQYAKYKQVSVSNVHYWIKKDYLSFVTIAGKKFIDIKSNPKKQLK